LIKRYLRGIDGHFFEGIDFIIGFVEDLENFARSALT
jgi:hypothetical protein